MEKTHHKASHHKKIYLSVAAGLLALLVISAGLAYFTSSSDPVTRVFKGLYPAGLAGGRFISLLARDNAQQVALAFDPKASSDAGMNLLVDISKKQQLLGSLGVTVTPQDLAAELNFLNADKESSYDELLQKYFKNDEQLFTDLVLAPRVYEALLAIKYNSDFKLNVSSHANAQSILELAKTGSDFASLAAGSSEDKVTGQLGGDLGFVREDQVLPELAAKLPSLKAGEIYPEIVISRAGYHVLSLTEIAEQNGEKLYHLKHILIKTSGAEQWLTQQLNQISVWRIK